MPNPIYPTPFLNQIIKTLAFEGGYVNDPDDPGGETNFGITKRSYPDTDIKNLTKDQAITIYYADYWLKPHIDRLPDWLSGKVFDIGVNMGSKTAIIILQNTYNSGYHDTQLDNDGIIGTQTSAAFAKITNTQGFLVNYRFALRDHYYNLAALHPQFQRFLNGWYRRAAA